MVVVVVGGGGGGREDREGKREKRAGEKSRVEREGEGER